MTYVNSSLAVPLLDALDRFSIMEIKRERLQNESDRKAVENEYAFFSRVLEHYRKNGVPIESAWMEELRAVNQKLWDVEAQIRTAKEHALSLPEVGELAVKLRDCNDERSRVRRSLEKKLDFDPFEIGKAPRGDTSLKVPLHEAIDRFTICELKLERLPKSAEHEKEYAFYREVIDEFRKEGAAIKNEWFSGLKEINARVWDMEGAIRQGREGEYGPAEMGRRTLELRNIGRERVAFKKMIARAAGSDFYEVKV